MPSRDFSKTHEPVWFTIDPDRYDCYSVLPLDDLKEFAEVIGTEVSVGNVVEKIKRVMQLVMEPVSYEKFEYRMGNRKDPIDPRQLMSIVEWLMEVYTDRPTPQPSSLSSGSPVDEPGSSSTAGAPDATSIHTVSIPSGSPI